MEYKFIKIITIFSLISVVIPVSAEEIYERIPIANPIIQQQEVDLSPTNIQLPKKIFLTQNNLENLFAIAYERFIQCNVKASYNDYKILIETMQPNDYGYMVIAEKMASIGFFDLAKLASSKIKSNDYATFWIDDIQRFYFPSGHLKKQEQLYLAEMFSNIIFNDQSKEATIELVKNTDLLTNSDYANYIVALGYLKSNDEKMALEYIDKAILTNTENLNYKKLKAEILAQNKKNKEALEIVELLKKQNLYSVEFNRKISSIEQYIRYKISKKDTDKNYHLGYYYYLEKEFAKSVRTLQMVTINKKKAPKEIYALLARVYFDTNDFEKSFDNAQKAHKMDGSNAIALEVLGDLYNRQKDYKNALKYYKTSANKNKSNPETLTKVAQIYQQMGMTKKAIETYAKILKTYSNCYLAYYETALLDKSKEYEYIKKSIAINKDFKDGWIDLARIEINRRNYEEAKKYLAIANYIDENDFRYYYYQGLIFKAEGSVGNAKTNFQKSLILNPDYLPAKEELSI